jgi:D-arabinose 1-dehydrogenase-like Zn-dependent alcohol dehydrogenase
MRAAIITQFNAPWQIQTLPDVRPSPGQVVIRVRASGMCGTDVHVHRGLFPVKAPIFCAGHTVVAGLRDASPQPGERVAVLGVGGLGHLAIQYANAFGLEVFAIAAAFNGLRPGGRLVNMGVIDGAMPIDGHALLMGQRQLRGSVPHERADLAEALAHVASGKVVPRLELYPLERVNHVRERLEAGKVRYRAVLVHASRGASAR